MSARPPRNRPGPSVQDVFASDRRPPPDILRFESPAENLGTVDIDASRYISDDWHAMEMEKVWRKVWQMACRVEDVPKIGDYIIYEIGDESVIVVRSDEHTIRGYINSCLHRGTLLRTQNGRAREFKCPFHGFAWDLDGSLSHVPSEWDFEHVDKANFCLPEVRIDTWGGFVFLNFDRECGPLSDFLEVLPEHFASFGLEDRWKAAHVRKIMPCNWKLALEAFLESFHIPVAHPQTTGYVAWDTTQYDVFAGSDHVNRMLTIEGVAATSAGDVSLDETIRQIQRDLPFHRGASNQSGVSPREVLAEHAREKMTKSSRRDLTALSNAEVLDVIQYFLFPNMVPWGGQGVPICYRFLPYENDPEKSVMEIMLLFSKAEDGSHPTPPPPIELGIEDQWQDAPVLGSAGYVADQDTENLRRIQRGLRASHKPGITLANYQESRIRHFHATLDKYVNE